MEVVMTLRISWGNASFNHNLSKVCGAVKRFQHTTGPIVFTSAMQKKRQKMARALDRLTPYPVHLRA